MSASIRDRPFNLQGGLWFFVLFRFFFLGQLESYNIYFFCRAKRIFFSQNSTLGYMTNTLNQIFFSSTKIRIFFQQHIFLEKTIPAPPFKLNGRSLTGCKTFTHFPNVVDSAYVYNIDSTFVL